MSESGDPSRPRFGSGAAIGARLTSSSSATSSNAPPASTSINTMNTNIAPTHTSSITKSDTETTTDTSDTPSQRIMPVSRFGFGVGNATLSDSMKPTITSIPNYNSHIILQSTAPSGRTSSSNSLSSAPVTSHIISTHGSGTPNSPLTTDLIDTTQKAAGHQSILTPSINLTNPPQLSSSLQPAAARSFSNSGLVVLTSPTTKKLPTSVSNPLNGLGTNSFESNPTSAISNYSPNSSFGSADPSIPAPFKRRVGFGAGAHALARSPETYTTTTSVVAPEAPPIPNLSAFTSTSAPTPILTSLPSTNGGVSQPGNNLSIAEGMPATKIPKPNSVVLNTPSSSTGATNSKSTSESKAELGSSFMKSINNSGLLPSSPSNADIFGIEQTPLKSTSVSTSPPKVISATNRKEIFSENASAKPLTNVLKIASSSTLASLAPIIVSDSVDNLSTSQSISTFNSNRSSVYNPVTVLTASTPIPTVVISTASTSNANTVTLTKAHLSKSSFSTPSLNGVDLETGKDSVSSLSILPISSLSKHSGVRTSSSTLISGLGLQVRTDSSSNLYAENEESQTKSPVSTSTSITVPPSTIGYPPVANSTPTLTLTPSVGLSLNSRLSFGSASNRALQTSGTGGMSTSHPLSSPPLGTSTIRTAKLLTPTGAGSQVLMTSPTSLRTVTVSSTGGIEAVPAVPGSTMHGTTGIGTGNGIGPGLGFATTTCSFSAPVLTSNSGSILEVNSPMVPKPRKFGSAFGRAHSLQTPMQTQAQLQSFSQGVGPIPSTLLSGEIAPSSSHSNGTIDLVSPILPISSTGVDSMTSISTSRPIDPWAPSFHPIISNALSPTTDVGLGSGSSTNTSFGSLTVTIPNEGSMSNASIVPYSTSTGVDLKFAGSPPLPLPTPFDESFASFSSTSASTSTSANIESAVSPTTTATTESISTSIPSNLVTASLPSSLPSSLQSGLTAVREYFGLDVDVDLGDEFQKPREGHALSPADLTSLLGVHLPTSLIASLGDLVSLALSFEDNFDTESGNLSSPSSSSLNSSSSSSTSSSLSLSSSPVKSLPSLPSKQDLALAIQKIDLAIGKLEAKKESYEQDLVIESAVDPTSAVVEELHISEMARLRLEQERTLAREHREGSFRIKMRAQKLSEEEIAALIAGGAVDDESSEDDEEVVPSACSSSRTVLLKDLNPQLREMRRAILKKKLDTSRQGAISAVQGLSWVSRFRQYTDVGKTLIDVVYEENRKKVLASQKEVYGILPDWILAQQNEEIAASKVAEKLEQEKQGKEEKRDKEKKNKQETDIKLTSPELESKEVTMVTKTADSTSVKLEPEVPQDMVDTHDINTLQYPNALKPSSTGSGDDGDPEELVDGDSNDDENADSDNDEDIEGDIDGEESAAPKLESKPPTDVGMADDIGIDIVVNAGMNDASILTTLSTTFNNSAVLTTSTTSTTPTIITSSAVTSTRQSRRAGERRSRLRNQNQAHYINGNFAPKSFNPSNQSENAMESGPTTTVSSASVSTVSYGEASAMSVIDPTGSSQTSSVLPRAEFAGVLYTPMYLTIDSSPNYYNVQATCRAYHPIVTAVLRERRRKLLLRCRKLALTHIRLAKEQITHLAREDAFRSHRHQQQQQQQNRAWLSVTRRNTNNSASAGTGATYSNTAILPPLQDASSGQASSIMVTNASISTTSSTSVVATTPAGPRSVRGRPRSSLPIASASPPPIAAPVRGRSVLGGWSSAKMSVGETGESGDIAVTTATSETTLITMGINGVNAETEATIAIPLPIRYAQNAAVPTNMILDPREQRARAFESHNSYVPDPREEQRLYELSNPWSDEEKDIFLKRYLKYPKNFYKIATFLPKKTTNDCVCYYYLSKQTINYKAMYRALNAKKKQPGRSGTANEKEKEKPSEKNDKNERGDKSSDKFGNIVVNFDKDDIVFPFQVPMSKSVEILRQRASTQAQNRLLEAQQRQKAREEQTHKELEEQRLRAREKEKEVPQSHGSIMNGLNGVNNTKRQTGETLGLTINRVASGNFGRFRKDPSKVQNTLNQTPQTQNNATKSVESLEKPHPEQSNVKNLRVKNENEDLLVSLHKVTTNVSKLRNVNSDNTSVTPITSIGAEISATSVVEALVVKSESSENVKPNRELGEAALTKAEAVKHEFVSLVDFKPITSSNSSDSSLIADMQIEKSHTSHTSGILSPQKQPRDESSDEVSLEPVAKRSCPSPKPKPQS